MYVSIQDTKSLISSAQYWSRVLGRPLKSMNVKRSSYIKRYFIKSCVATGCNFLLIKGSQTTNGTDGFQSFKINANVTIV